MDIASDRASNAATWPMPSISDGTASSHPLSVEMSVVQGLQLCQLRAVPFTAVNVRIAT